MLTGTRYRLNAPTLAIEAIGDERIAVPLPKGETIEVLRGPRPDDNRMIDIRWLGRDLMMFAADLHARGEYVGSAGA